MQEETSCDVLLLLLDRISIVEIPFTVQFFSCLVELISSELFPLASVFLDFWVIVCPFLICQIDVILTILYFLPNTPLICEVPCMEMPNPDFLCDLLKV